MCNSTPRKMVYYVQHVEHQIMWLLRISSSSPQFFRTRAPIRDLNKTQQKLSSQLSSEENRVSFLELSEYGKILSRSSSFQLTYRFSCGQLHLQRRKLLKLHTPKIYHQFLREMVIWPELDFLRL